MVLGALPALMAMAAALWLVSPEPKGSFAARGAGGAPAEARVFFFRGGG